MGPQIFARLFFLKLGVLVQIVDFSTILLHRMQNAADLMDIFGDTSDQVSEIFLLVLQTSVENLTIHLHTEQLREVELLDFGLFV